MKTRTLLVLVLPLALLAACGTPPPQEEEAAPEAAAEGLANGSFTAELNGFSIHYEVHGRGPVVMTLPNSWGLTLDGLRAFYRPLEEHLTMVYFDPRGMGGSGEVREDADMGLAAVRADFDALRRHLGLEKVHAVGWSNGAMNLLLLASEMPETLESAIFLHGASRFSQENMREFAESHPELVGRWAALQQELAGEEMPVEEKDARVKRFWVEEWFPLSTADPEATGPKLAEIYREVGFSWRHGRYANQESPSFDARDRLAAITVPSLVIAGAHDLLPVELAREIAEGAPEATFVVFESSGHFAPVEEPEAFQTTVLEFLGVS